MDEARKREDMLWFISDHADTPLHSSLPLNTAVAVPISLSVLRRDLCFVFFAEPDVHVRELRRDQECTCVSSSWFKSCSCVVLLVSSCSALALVT